MKNKITVLMSRLKLNNEEKRFFDVCAVWTLPRPELMLKTPQTRVDLYLNNQLKLSFDATRTETS